jgi:poly-beta-1,6-N-acetyl-D-glucosamine synthase
MNIRRRYVLISPCRDEARHMRRTLDSVAAQAVPPALWVVVDDGSTDATPEILREYARRLPYLKVVRRDDRGRRSVGPGVMEAFHAGLDTVDLDHFEYLCKLDLDLVLPARYFEGLIARMEANPRLGTTSGKPYFHAADGTLVAETIGDEMSVGASKFYRTACYREIGGFVRQVMWDGIDCHRSRMRGWMAESVDQEELRFLHLRPMGSSQKGGIWAGRARTGFGQYFMGTSPLFVLASALFRLPRHPVLYGSAAILWGYFSSAARGLPRYEDEVFRLFLRRYQRDCLLRGKREATRRLETAQAPVWHAAHPAIAPGEGAGRAARSA